MRRIHGGLDAAYRRHLLEVDMVIRVATFDKKPAAHDDEKLMGKFLRTAAA